MANDRSIQAVLFDVGGTLLVVKPSVGAVYAETAAAHGFEVKPEEIQRRFKTAWKQSLERSQARNYLCSDEILRQEWFEIVRCTFEQVVPAPCIHSLFEDLYERFSSPGAWSLAPWARSSLAYLKGRGLRLGILSNWDSRLPRMLQDLNIHDAFDFHVISHQVGVEKPHREIFRQALKKAGAEPVCTLYVADSYQADIEPARELGLKTFWLAAQTERDASGYRGLGAERLPDNPINAWEQVLLAT